MRILIQRVTFAEVTVDGKSVGKIGKGALIFFGVHKDDTEHLTVWLAQKLLDLRFFSDEKGKMNLNLKDAGGELLIVSQFTLYGNCLKGRRPDFLDAAPAEFARHCYEKFIREISLNLDKVETGIFGANMRVELINDGPVTFIIDAPA